MQFSKHFPHRRKKITSDEVFDFANALDHSLDLRFRYQILLCNFHLGCLFSPHMGFLKDLKSFCITMPFIFLLQYVCTYFLESKFM